ncbi:MAG: hypothetical protein AB2564_20290, partial [Candidatus Thiodiazotropha sp.]
SGKDKQFCIAVWPASVYKDANGDVESCLLEGKYLCLGWICTRITKYHNATSQPNSIFPVWEHHSTQFFH